MIRFLLFPGFGESLLLSGAHDDKRLTQPPGSRDVRSLLVLFSALLLLRCEMVAVPFRAVFPRTVLKVFRTDVIFPDIL